MASSRSARASRAHDAAPSRADDSEDKGGGLPGEHDAGDGKKEISRKKILVVTHRGATLTERVVDAYTTEYRVTRSVRAVVLSSYAPAWCVLAVALAATEWTVATKRDGAGDGWIGKFRETKLAWFAVAAFAIATRVMANTVVAESLVVMRHVGVRLSSHSLVPLRKKRKTKFLDVDRLKSIVVNEALGAKGVCVVLCFRFFGDGDDHGEHVSANSFGDTMHTEKGCTTPTEKQSNSLTTPQNRRVALVFPALRPGLPIIKQVYRSAHAALFSEEDGDDDDENSKSQTDDNSDSFRCLPGPASGHGWWRGRDGKENCGGDDEFEGLFEEEAMNTTAKDGAPNGPSVSARKQTETQKNRHSILMVSDFFLPNLGGVEVHMFSLAQRLLERGHRVTVLTHAYGNRCGVRYMTNGLKVYYAFRVPVYAGCTCPDLFGNFKLQRQIMLREKITLVHAHQTFSVMGHEAIFHARTMGYKCVFTDHSLFGFSDTSAIHMNKLLVLTLADCNHVICVSHVAKENTVLRSGIPPKRVSVVPNAVDHVRFKPDDVPPGSNSNRVVVAVTARLARRKGVHLLAAGTRRAFPKSATRCLPIQGLTLFISNAGDCCPHGATCSSCVLLVFPDARAVRTDGRRLLTRPSFNAWITRYTRLTLSFHNHEERKVRRRTSHVRGGVRDDSGVRERLDRLRCCFASRRRPRFRGVRASGSQRARFLKRERVGMALRGVALGEANRRRRTRRRERV
jgi:hypothetical protein